jgi:C4-dicarboxylate-specific signal transduction histidine kinase
MLDKTVLHKRNGHRTLPDSRPLSPGQLIGLVHSDRSAIDGSAADLLRFAAVVRSEQLAAPPARAPRDAGLMAASLERVLARTETLLGRGQLPELSRGLARLAAQAEVAARMVERLTGLTVESGRRASGQGERRPVNLNEIVTRALGLLSARPEPLPEVAARLDPRLPRVAGDAIELQQALLALLGVAQRVAGQGGGGRGVRVETAQAAGALMGERVVTVLIEVPSAIPDHDPAHAAEPSADGDEPDTWMGPAVRLVARILAEHGGALSMLPARGVQACFRVELPGI